MTPAPKRRWSYSLRTLFVVVTVGAVLAWYFRSQDFPFTVVGDLSTTDVRAICKAMAENPKTKNDAILSIELIEPGYVDVITDGSDQSIRLGEKDGEWVVLEVTVRLL
jgi:hypothetical protein